MISLIAEKRLLLKNLFAVTEYSPEGVFGMLLNMNGSWTEVIVDDQLACLDKDTLLFATVSKRAAFALYNLKLNYSSMAVCISIC